MPAPTIVRQLRIFTPERVDRSFRWYLETRSRIRNQFETDDTGNIVSESWEGPATYPTVFATVISFEADP